ncbi:MAG: type II toxin-antitoxin system RelE/ParE family toxin [Candidatus Binatia bacterium]
MPIRNFKNRATQDINYARKTRAARHLLAVSLHEKAQVKLARLAAAESLNDLTSLPGNRFEVLKGDRQGQQSTRINDQYRICFRWGDNGAEDVEIVDYH